MKLARQSFLAAGLFLAAACGSNNGSDEYQAAVPTFRHWRTSRALQATVLCFRSPLQSAAIFAPHTERHSAVEAAGLATARSTPARTPTVRTAAMRNCLTFMLLQSCRPM